MKRDDIRRLLRDADPARDRELPPHECLRMRDRVISSGGALHRGWMGKLALAGAGAVVIAAVAALTPRPPVPTTTHALRPAIRISPTPIAAPAFQMKTSPARTHVRSARRVEPKQTTRIDFTGPEGTRILWFVESGDAKELGS